MTMTTLALAIAIQIQPPPPEPDPLQVKAEQAMSDALDMLMYAHGRVLYMQLQLYYEPSPLQQPFVDDAQAILLDGYLWLQSAQGWHQQQNWPMCIGDAGGAMIKAAECLATLNAMPGG